MSLHVITYTTIIAKRSTIITSFVLVLHWFHSWLIQTASGWLWAEWAESVRLQTVLVGF